MSTAAEGAQRQKGVKGASTLAYGPCANPTCTHRLCTFATCTCNCGYTGTGEVPEHSVYHPDCTSRTGREACVTIGEGETWPSHMCTITTRSQPTEIPALVLGRQLGDPAYTEDHAGTGHSGNPDWRWRSIRPTIAEAMGMTLLPANAVLCHWCWTSLDTLTKRSRHDQIRQRANTIVSQHVALLPDLVVCSLAAVITHLLWLRGTARRCVWTVARFRVRSFEMDACSAVA